MASLVALQPEISVMRLSFIEQYVLCNLSPGQFRGCRRLLRFSCGDRCRCMCYWSRRSIELRSIASPCRRGRCRPWGCWIRRCRTVRRRSARILWLGRSRVGRRRTIRNSSLTIFLGSGIGRLISRLHLTAVCFLVATASEGSSNSAASSRTASSTTATPATAEIASLPVARKIL